jgi:Uma2 family endonuclease
VDKREKWIVSANNKRRLCSDCPDFVIELKSPSDSSSTLHSKMLEYIANGASLGWLIDPLKRRVSVYRRDEELVILENPEVVSGDPVLRGFELKMDELW